MKQKISDEDYLV
jgi:DNA repair ATPase RecN